MIGGGTPQQAEGAYLLCAGEAFRCGRRSQVNQTQGWAFSAAERPFSSHTGRSVMLFLSNFAAFCCLDFVFSVFMGVIDQIQINSRSEC